MTQPPLGHVLVRIFDEIEDPDYTLEWFDVGTGNRWWVSQQWRVCGYLCQTLGVVVIDCFVRHSNGSTKEAEKLTRELLGQAGVKLASWTSLSRDMLGTADDAKFQLRDMVARVGGCTFMPAQAMRESVAVADDWRKKMGQVREQLREEMKRRKALAALKGKGE